jgi:hypothetical protein
MHFSSFVSIKTIHGFTLDLFLRRSGQSSKNAPCDEIDHYFPFSSLLMDLFGGLIAWLYPSVDASSQVTKEQHRAETEIENLEQQSTFPLWVEVVNVSVELEFQVTEETTLLELKEQISERLGWEEEQQILYLGYTALSGNKKLKEWGIKAEDTLKLEPGLLGGEAMCCVCFVPCPPPCCKKKKKGEDGDDSDEKAPKNNYY